MSRNMKIILVLVSIGIYLCWQEALHKDRLELKRSQDLTDKIMERKLENSKPVRVRIVND